MAEPDPHALPMLIIAELHKIGMFDSVNLASIARRLELAGDPETAERVRFLPLSNALTDPAEMRAGMYVVDEDED